MVKPAPAIATAAIFGSPLLVRNTEPVIVMSFLADAQLAATLGSGYGRNDLQPPAEASCPEVTQVARWLEARFGNSRMTGSGSTVFSWLDHDAQPENGFQPRDVGLNDPDWVGRVTRGLPRHPLLEMLDPICD